MYACVLATITPTTSSRMSSSGRGQHDGRSPHEAAAPSSASDAAAAAAAASSSSDFIFDLPARSTYLKTMSTAAFVTGLGIATVISVRRARADRVHEARAAIVAAQQQASSSSSSTVHGAIAKQPPPPQSAEVDPLVQASSKGVFALFKEMNRTVLSGAAPAQTATSSSAESMNEAPSILRKRVKTNTPTPSSASIASSSSSTPSRGKAAVTSIFDAPPSAPPPSVLMRRTPAEAAEAAFAAARHPQPLFVSAASDRPPQTLWQKAQAGWKAARSGLASDEFGEAPVVLAVKALVFATACVGAGAWVAVEVTCRVLDVGSMDELAEKIATHRSPSKREMDSLVEPSSSPAWTTQFSLEARKKLGGMLGHDFTTHEDVDAAVVLTDAQLRQQRLHDGTMMTTTTAALEGPLPVGEAVRQLDDAIDRGDAASWMELISRQLNAERRKDLEERQQRLAADSSNSRAR